MSLLRRDAAVYYVLIPPVVVQVCHFPREPRGDSRRSHMYEYRNMLDGHTSFTLISLFGGTSMITRDRGRETVDVVNERNWSTHTLVFVCQSLQR